MLVVTLWILELKIYFWTYVVVKYIQSESTIKKICNRIYTKNYMQWIFRVLRNLKFVRLTFKVWTRVGQNFSQFDHSSFVWKTFLCMEFALFTAQSTISRQLLSFQALVNQCLFCWPSKNEYWLTIHQIQDLIYYMPIDTRAIILPKLFHCLL